MSGLLTAGGLAGYFRKGTRKTVRKAPSATSPAVARAPRRPIRPSAKQNTSEAIPPSAVLKINPPVADPAVDCTRRLTNSVSWPVAWAVS